MSSAYFFLMDFFGIRNLLIYAHSNIMPVKFDASFSRFTWTELLRSSRCLRPWRTNSLWCSIRCLGLRMSGRHRDFPANSSELGAPWSRLSMRILLDRVVYWTLDWPTERSIDRLFSPLIDWLIDWLQQKTWFLFVVVFGFWFSIFRVLHSPTGSRNNTLSRSQKLTANGETPITFQIRIGSRHGIEYHVFKLETCRDLSSWVKSVIQGTFRAVELTQEVSWGEWEEKYEGCFLARMPIIISSNTGNFFCRLCLAGPWCEINTPFWGRILPHRVVVVRRKFIALWDDVAKAVWETQIHGGRRKAIALFRVYWLHRTLRE